MLGMWNRNKEKVNEAYKDGFYMEDLWSKKMKTDKQTQIAILKRVIENIEGDRKAMDGIQFFGLNGEWEDKTIFELHFNLFSYRIKPKTITLANGVVIPEPLDYVHSDTNNYYVPMGNNEMYQEVEWREAIDKGWFAMYRTKREAIEASKALFGID